MYSDWKQQYTFSLYFSITTMLTVGYGDITPTNDDEAIFVIVAMLISCAVFAYSFNLIGQLVQDMNKNKQIFYKEMLEVNRYLDNKQISNNLCLQIRKYLEYKKVDEKQISYQQEQKIAKKLNQYFSEKIQSEISQILLQNCKNIFSKFSEQAQLKISKNFEENRYSTNDVIFEEGEFDYSPNFYYIESGSVEIYYESSKGKYNHVSVATLKKGQYFGEISFFTGQTRLVSAKSLEFTVIKQISRLNMIQILKKFKDDYNLFIYIKDQIMIYNRLEIINLKCSCCGINNHVALHWYLK